MVEHPKIKLLLVGALLISLHSSLCLNPLLDFLKHNTTVMSSAPKLHMTLVHAALKKILWQFVEHPNGFLCVGNFSKFFEMQMKQISKFYRFAFQEQCVEVCTAERVHSYISFSFHKALPLCNRSITLPSGRMRRDQKCLRAAAICDTEIPICDKQDLWDFPSDLKQKDCICTCNYFGYMEYFCLVKSLSHFRIHPQLRLTLSFENFHIQSPFCEHGRVLVRAGSSVVAPSVIFSGGGEPNDTLYWTSEERYCGHQGKFIYYSPSSKLDVEMGIYQEKINFSILFSYQVLDSNVVETSSDLNENITVLQPEKFEKFLVPAHDHIFQKVLIETNKTNRLLINRTNCLNSCWLFDHPGHDRKLSMKGPSQHVMETKTFAIWVYTVISDDTQRYFVQYNTVVARVDQTIHVNKSAVFLRFNSSGLSNNKLILFLVPRGLHLNLSLLHMVYEDNVGSNSCLLGGFALFDKTKNYHNFMPRASICTSYEYFSGLKSYYSIGSQFFVVLHSFAAFSRLEIHFQLQQTVCKPFTIDLCSWEPVCTLKKLNMLRKHLREQQKLYNTAGIFDISYPGTGQSLYKYQYTSAQKCIFSFHSGHPEFQSDRFLVSTQEDSCIVIHFAHLQTQKFNAFLEHFLCEFAIQPRPIPECGRVTKLNITGSMHHEGLIRRTTNVVYKRPGDMYSPGLVKFDGIMDKFIYQEWDPKTCPPSKYVISTTLKEEFSQKTRQFDPPRSHFKLNVETRSPTTAAALRMRVLFPSWLLDSWVDMVLQWNMSGKQVTSSKCGLSQRDLLVNSTGRQLTNFPRYPSSKDSMLILKLMNKSESLPPGLTTQVEVSVAQRRQFDPRHDAARWSSLLHFTHKHTTKHISVQYDFTGISVRKRNMRRTAVPIRG